jgi:hypothetical protein
LAISQLSERKIFRGVNLKALSSTEDIEIIKDRVGVVSLVSDNGCLLTVNDSSVLVNGKDIEFFSKDISVDGVLELLSNQKVVFDLVEKFTGPTSSTLFAENIRLIPTSNPDKTVPDSVKKGIAGERMFIVWLNRVGLSFLQLNQTKDTMPFLFKGNIKRPDFLVLLQGISFIAVDVKNFDSEFIIEIKEIDKTISFELSCKLSVWFVFVDKQNEGNGWYWIGAHTVKNIGQIVSRHGKKMFLIRPSNCQHITTAEDMAKLYTEKFSSYRNIKQ